MYKRSVESVTPLSSELLSFRHDYLMRKLHKPCSKISRTEPARESERSLHINNFAPVCLRVLRVIFFWVPVCLRLLHTKFHRLKTKTFCLRAYKRDRMGSLQYEYGWNHGVEKEPSLQCGPKLLKPPKLLQDSKATSLPQLKQEIKELWTLKMDDIQYLKNIVESMPRRLEVILNEGNATKYSTSQYVARTPSTPKSFNKKRLNLFLLYFSKDRSLSRAGTGISVRFGGKI